MTKIEFCMSEDNVERLNRIREAMENVIEIRDDTDGSYNINTHEWKYDSPEYEHLCKAVDELALAYSTYVAMAVYEYGKDLK